MHALLVALCNDVSLSICLSLIPPHLFSCLNLLFPPLEMPLSSYYFTTLLLLCSICFCFERGSPLLGYCRIEYCFLPCIVHPWKCYLLPPPLLACCCRVQSVGLEGHHSLRCSFIWSAGTIILAGTGVDNMSVDFGCVGN